jgi:hypothetical protein
MESCQDQYCALPQHGTGGIRTSDLRSAAGWQEVAQINNHKGSQAKRTIQAKVDSIPSVKITAGKRVLIKRLRETDMELGLSNRVISRFVSPAEGTPLV